MTESHQFVIIGAGPAGIAMGVKLLERGVDDFVILERADGLGGTWRDNRYPGVACDVPANYYAYSFAPNTLARNRFASGRELLGYFSGIADRYGVTSHVRYRAEVATADWDGAAWDLVTTAGARIRADFVITAVGRLHRPSIPDIPGVETFRGTIRHSAEWDPAYDLAGKRLGVIGSGSSSTQIVASAALQVDHLDVFQRSAHWVMPVPNEPLPESEIAELTGGSDSALAYFQRIEQQSIKIYESMESDRETYAQLCRDALAAIADPVLRAKLTPSYEFGCKRIVMSSEFYTSVQRENVSVVVEGIERIEPDGIRTTDGAFHPLDAIILATGFHADGFLRPMQVTGEGGITLDDIWKDVFLNYKSVLLPHMPNFFTINGPFSPGGGNSILNIIEIHIGYIDRVLDRVLTTGAAVVPDPDRSAELVDAIRERARHTIWFTGGCTSWYLDRNGVPLVNPLTPTQLREDMAEVNWDDLLLQQLARH